jgi:hypothetical protein
MHIASIGIDIGKTTFHVVALNAHGSVVVRRKFSRKQLLAYTANLAASATAPTNPCRLASDRARWSTRLHSQRIAAASFRATIP